MVRRGGGREAQEKVEFTHFRGTASHALFTLFIRCDSRLQVALGFLCTARCFLPFVNALL